MTWTTGILVGALIGLVGGYALGRRDAKDAMVGRQRRWWQ